MRQVEYRPARGLGPGGTREDPDEQRRVTRPTGRLLGEWPVPVGPAEQRVHVVRRRQFRVGDAGRPFVQAGQPLPALVGTPPLQPPLLDRGHQAQPVPGGPAGGTPLQRRTQLGCERVDRLQGHGIGGDGLAYPGHVPAPGGGLLAGLGEAPGGVPADRLGEPVPGAVRADLGLYQGPVHEVGQGIEDVPVSLHCGQSDRSGEDGELPQQRGGRRFEGPVRAVHRTGERTVHDGQTVGQLGNRQHPEPVRRRLQRQGQPVEPLGELTKAYHFRLCQGATTPGRDRAVEQQSRAIGGRQRRDPPHQLARQPQRLPAGGQHGDPGAGGEQAGGERGGRGRRGVAGVQDQQEPARRDEVGERVQHRTPGLGPQPECGRDRRVGLGPGGEVDVPGAVRVPVVAGRLDRQPGLARPARADDADQPVFVQQRAQLRPLGRPADETGDRYG